MSRRLSEHYSEVDIALYFVAPPTPPATTGDDLRSGNVSYFWDLQVLYYAYNPLADLTLSPFPFALSAPFGFVGLSPPLEHASLRP